MSGYTFELTPLDFTNSFEGLPASASPEHAHIINLRSYIPDYDVGQYDIKIWDALATMLFKISKDTLSNFLDPGNKTFKLSQKLYTDSNFLVWRRENEVLIAQYVQHAERNLLEFDLLVRCSIDDNGSWKIQDASYGQYTRDNLNDVRSFVVPTGTHIQQALVATDEKSKSERATSLARSIILERYWEFGGIQRVIEMS